MIYVASSWRNPRYPGILDCLEQWNIAYYDWRDEDGFHWSEVFGGLVYVNQAGETVHLMDLKVDHWTDPIPAEIFAQAMEHPRAKEGFARDMRHLERAESVILLLPCGKSAHLEAGWAAGAGKPVALYMPEDLQPELMYGMFGDHVTDIESLMRWADDHTEERIIGPNAYRWKLHTPKPGGPVIGVAQREIKAGEYVNLDLKTGEIG